MPSSLKIVKHSFLAAASCTLFAFSAAMALAGEDEHSFKVHNKTEVKITGILVSQDGKEYGKFDIGEGIGAGKTVNLVWDKSTDSESCKQFVKAVYADESESEPAKFDFCEADLVIEFEE